MRALRFHTAGAPDVLTVESIDQPSPGSGEALIRIAFSSINPSDVKNVAGAFHASMPKTPGRDYSGTVLTGPPEWIGKRVFGCGGWDLGIAIDGAHAECLAVPAEALTEVPARVSLREAAAFGVPYVTAIHGLESAGGIGPGDVIAVIGAQGAVGTAVAQFAKAVGTSVIAIDRKPMPPDAPIAPFVDASIDGSTQNPIDKVMELTNNAGANVVFNTVGGPLFEPGLQMLAKNGRHIVISSVGDRRVSFDLIDFYHKQTRLIGVDSMSLDTVACRRFVELTAAAVNAGRLTIPAIDDRVFTLDSAVDAYRLVESGRAKGKVILTIGDDN